MTATEALAVIVAALISVLSTAVVVRPTWSPTAKRATALVVALVLGTLAALVSGQIDGLPAGLTDTIQHVVISAAAVIVAAQGIHRQLAGAMGTLTAATSPATTSVPVPLADAVPDAAYDPDDEAPRHADPSTIPDAEGVATTQES